MGVRREFISLWGLLFGLLVAALERFVLEAGVLRPPGGFGLLSPLPFDGRCGLRLLCFLRLPPPSCRYAAIAATDCSDYWQYT